MRKLISFPKLTQPVKEAKEVVTDNVVHIKTPHALFTVIYGMHIVSQDPQEIPDGVDAVVLETGMHTWADDPVKTTRDLKRHVQYRKLFERFEAERIPVVYADMRYSANNHVLLIVDNAFSTLEWMLGLRVLQDNMQTVKSKSAGSKKNSRAVVRSGMNFALAGWLLLPFASTIATLLSSTTGVGRKYSAGLKKLSHKLHPEAEFLFLTARNAVIAEKMHYLAQIFGKSAHIAVVLGAGHAGVEDMLKKTKEERLEYLKRLQPILSKLVSPYYFSQVIQMKFTGSDWQVNNGFAVNSLRQAFGASQ